MGVLDEVKILEANEVFIAYSENGNDIKYVKGLVTITKNPCLHPGDI